MDRPIEVDSMSLRFVEEKNDNFEGKLQQSMAFGVALLMSLRFVEEKNDNFEGKLQQSMAFGVALFIIGAIPLIAAGALDAEEYIRGICVALLLVLISIGVTMIVNAEMLREGYEKVVQIGEYTLE